MKRRACQHFNIKICKKIGNKHLGNWLLSVLNKDLIPEIEIIEECTDNWMESEQYWIEQLKVWGFRLLNLTKGGEGFFNKHSEVTKLKMSTSHKGKKLSKEHIESMSNTLKGRKPGNCKRVIDTLTNIIYNDVLEASISLNISYAKLYNMLTGRTINKTNLNFYENNI